MKNNSFKDYFSAQSSEYERFRPVYPDSLYAYLASIAPSTNLVWDCATGNGQAAIGLSQYFNEVIATDASEQQLAHAKKGAKIEYRVARAEQSGLATSSADLVTVAQALHWFDINAFFKEVNRVLKPGGVVAIWSYNLLSVSNDVDKIIHRLYAEILREFWPPERRLIESGYRDIPFPFLRIPNPHISMQAQWTLLELVGYLQTWSAVQKFIATNVRNPVQEIMPALQDAWGGSVGGVQRIYWPLAFHIGKKME